MKNGEVKNIDLSRQNVLSMRDAQSAVSAGATHVRVCEKCVITPSARDFLRQHEIELLTGAAAAATPAPTPKPTPAPVAASSGGTKARIINVAGGGNAKSTPVTHRAPDPRLFTTSEAEAIKLEICAVGKKLWNRQYVDGNGGNISYRIGPE